MGKQALDDRDGCGGPYPTGELAYINPVKKFVEKGKEVTSLCRSGDGIGTVENDGWCVRNNYSSRPDQLVCLVRLYDFLK